MRYSRMGTIGAIRLGRSPARTTLGLCLISATLLAACAQREIILPGKREPITSVLSSTGPIDEEGAAAAAVTEGARDISLPAQVANADAAQSFGTPDFRTDHPQLNATLTPVFAVNIGAGDSRKHRIVADPVVSGGRVFTLDSETQVTAVSTSGAVLWQADVLPDGAKSGDATGGGLAVEGEVLYVATGFGALTALDVATGAEIWTQKLEGTGSGRPTVFDDLVYVMAGDDTGWALDKSNGRIEWQVTGSESLTNVLGAPAPIVTDGLAVFSFGSGEMRAVFRQGGLRRWDASVLGERQGRALAKFGDVTGRPIARDGVIYAGNQSGRTVAVASGSGNRIWTSDEGAIDTVLPVADSVFLVSDRNELLRLDGADGTRIWGTPLPNFVRDRPTRQSEVFAHHGPILAGGRLHVASSDGVLRSFDPASGALVGTTEIPGGATTAPVVAGQTLYVVSRKGQLIAYR
ncbi:PQQ-like beta-propeller repeat protein [uncultured Tateyamaria sp.]|uniref:PQQ-like beta-propeller repeat protein n=1 Tax=uncultured Tateyamaria sp. TaxID=455651 RepID=UPI0026357340|nr:PQQ-like beta-propeller repeat protein [uncultured Tateyamaria sp.]